jgi:hypothetical protein
MMIVVDENEVVVVVVDDDDDYWLTFCGSTTCFSLIILAYRIQRGYSPPYYFGISTYPFYFIFLFDSCWIPV